MSEPRVHVLRLGHRYVRDKRVTTHLLLAARVFGAHKVLYTGQRDGELEKSIQKINETWGGSFKVEHTENWERIIENWKRNEGEIIHLTMYGLPIQDVIHSVRESQRDKLIVVGGAKVPRVVFKMADWNISVTSQPHSEISALCIFLHELFEGKELSKTFENAKIRIIPQADGKKIELTGTLGFTSVS